MRNIKITIEYDGSRYQGWTRLGKDESNNTISAKIIDVLGKMTGEKNIELNCGCRTEVGVHAYVQKIFSIILIGICQWILQLRKLKRFQIVSMPS